MHSIDELKLKGSNLKLALDVLDGIYLSYRLITGIFKRTLDMIEYVENITNDSRSGEHSECDAD